MKRILVLARSAPFMEGKCMKGLLGCLLILMGFLLAGCEGFGERQDRDARLGGGGPEVEVTVQQ
jgi:hypothetical protein